MDEWDLQRMQTIVSQNENWLKQIINFTLFSFEALEKNLLSYDVTYVYDADGFIKSYEYYDARGKIYTKNCTYNNDKQLISIVFVGDFPPGFKNKKVITYQNGKISQISYTKT